MPGSDPCPVASHRDHLSSVRAITNGVGAVVERAVYKPFGEQSEWQSASQPAPETKGWIGERFDADAGLQHLNARYYDPQLGMFLQPDWWEVIEPGVGTNRFAYSMNDPVNFSDPGGHWATAAARTAAAIPAAIQAGRTAIAVASAVAGGKSISDAINHVRQTRQAEQTKLARDLMQEAEQIVERSRSRELGMAMVKALGLPRVKGENPHHIVAENDKRAAVARAVLQSLKIGVNSAENGVFVDKKQHARMHTNTYHARVSAGIVSVAASQPNVASARTAVIGELNQIRAEIIAGMW